MTAKTLLSAPLLASGLFLAYTTHLSSPEKAYPGIVRGASIRLLSANHADTVYTVEEVRGTLVRLRTPLVTFQPSENPYERFGDDIIVREFEGDVLFVTKEYTVPAGMGQRILEAMQNHEPFPFRERPAAPEPPPNPGVVEYSLQEAARRDVPSSQPLANADPDGFLDAISVTATPVLLDSFERYLMNFGHIDKTPSFQLWELSHKHSARDWWINMNAIHGYSIVTTTSQAVDAANPPEQR